MATKPDSVIAPFTANGDLSAKQYYGVKLGSAEGDVDLAGDAEEAIGVLVGAGADNMPVSVAVGGGTKAIASGAIAVDKKCNFDANGKLQEASATEFYFCRTIEPALADGDIVAIIIEKGFVPA